VKEIGLLSKKRDTGEVFGGNDDPLSIMNLPGSLAMPTVKRVLLGLRRKKKPSSR